MYVETVLYLPMGKTLRLGTPLSLFYNAGQCTISGTTASCYLDINADLAEAPFKILSSSSTTPAETLAEIREKIKSQDVCVYKEMQGTNEPKWILFWNQQKVLNALDARKNAIPSADSGVNLCSEYRPIIG